MRFRFPPHAWNLPLILVLLVGATQTADATTVIPMNSIDLQIRSDVIVVGHVVEQKTRQAERGLIVTDVIIQVEQPLKGRTTERITVRQPGGRIGETIQVVDEAPTFAPGEHLLLFLRENRAHGFYAVTGLYQGKFTLVPAAGGRLRLERRGPSGAEAGLARTLQPGTRWEHLDEFVASPEVDLN